MRTRINSRTVLARLRQSSFIIDKKVYYPSNKVYITFYVKMGLKLITD